MRIVVATLTLSALVTLAGCGHGSASPGPAITPGKAVSTASDEQLPRRAWVQALGQLVRAGTASYSWSERVTGLAKPIQTETGEFGLTPRRATLTRTMTDVSSSSPTTYTVRMRTFPGKSYLQMDDWGSWNGCWLAMTSGQAATASGIQGVTLGGLPESIDALITSRLRGHHPGSATEYDGDVAAAVALPALGVSARSFAASLAKLATARVPVRVELDGSGAFHTLTLDGAAIARTLSSASIGISSQLIDAISDLTATVRITGAGRPLSVRDPAPAQLLPADATKDTTCAAHR